MSGVRITDTVILKAFGEMTGSAAAAPFTSVKGAHWAKFKAKAGNTGIVAIGFTGVTLPAGTTTSTAGWPLSAKEETDWLPIPDGDLANLFYIGTDANQHVSYKVM